MGRLTHKHKYRPNSKRYVFDMENYRKVCQKLGQLEDIEEELGIDLITLFKALKNGFYYKQGFYNIKTKKVETIIHYSSYAYFYYDNETNTYLISTVDFGFYLNSYGKDWALTKEELL